MQGRRGAGEQACFGAPPSRRLLLLAAEPARRRRAIAPFLPRSPAPLLPRMMGLSEAYQVERPNVETADLTGLVIRALGMVVGKTLRDERASSTTSTTNTTSTTCGEKPCFIPTAIVTGAVQKLAEALEIDIHIENITSTRVGRILIKMRLPNKRLPMGGKRGWTVTLGDVIRLAESYGLNTFEITGLDHALLFPSGTSGTPGTSGTTTALNPYHGEL